MRGGGEQGEGILTPRQKVNKFVLNDWSGGSRDKGSPAETGSRGVAGGAHSSVVPDILGKAKSWGGSEKEFHMLRPVINSSTP